MTPDDGVYFGLVVLIFLRSKGVQLLVITPPGDSMRIVFFVEMFVGGDLWFLELEFFDGIYNALNPNLEPR